MLKPWKRRRWPLTSVSKIEARTEFGEERGTFSVRLSDGRHGR
jgi:hypothetical protein